MARAPKVPGTVYLVGGAVRDRLLGKAGSDRDFVVVGAMPEQMTAAGFKPVGGGFPVFIHPRSGEEYALARTEKKSGRGYRGFVFYSAPDVTLQDDLRRRDLTINAIAEDAAGNIIDPHGGREDLQKRVLRHVSPAFGEDPVRILRAARFAAQFPNFSIAPQTLALMGEMVANGEAAELKPERVWRELSRGLVAKKPSRMLNALAKCGALQIILPEVDALRGVPERLDYHPEGESFIHTCMVIDAAAARHPDAAECFAALLHDIGKGQTPKHILPGHHGHEKRSAALAKVVCARLKIPNKTADLAILAAGEHGNVHNALEMRAATLCDLLTRADAFRRPERFEQLLRVCEADFYFLPRNAGKPYPQGEFIRKVRTAAAAAPTADITAAYKEKGEEKQIPQQIRQAKIKAIRNLQKNNE